MPALTPARARRQANTVTGSDQLVRTARRGALLAFSALLIMGQAPVQDHPMRTIQMARGTSTVTVSQSLERGAADTYRFTAKAGQTADIRITAADSNASFVIYAPPATAVRSADGSGFDISGSTVPGGDKTVPPLDAGAQKHWRGALPKTGTYYIEISTDAGNADYKLTVQIK